MEVAIPNPDFDFPSSALATPYSSTPATPSRFGECFFSAPTSPSREFDEFSSGGDLYGSRSPPAVPYKWESKPGTPKFDRNDDADFAFDFSEDLERTSLSADELFDGGKIKALKPPPRLQNVETKRYAPAGERGRERSVNSSGNLSPSRSGRRATRSLSPLRAYKFPWEEDKEKYRDSKTESGQHQQQQQNKQLALFPKPCSSSATKSSSSKKWRLRDFLLFRSASEGRATDKDPFRSKYCESHCGKRQDDSVKNGSFRAAGESLRSGRQRRTGV